MILISNQVQVDEIFILPGEKVSDFLLEKLAVANRLYSQSKNFPKYKRSIQTIFQLKPLSRKTKDCHYYLAGFLEGEASLNVGAKKNAESKFKVYLDPEFSVTQHINGISNLFLALSIFQTGRIRFKTGSRATFVYTVDNRQSLGEKIIPFYEKFICPYGSQAKIKRLQIFKRLLKLFNEKAHLDLNPMLYEVLPLWHQLRVQIGQSNESFASLQAAQAYVENACNTTLLKSRKERGERK